VILDTNGLSALADGSPDLEPILSSADQIALPVIVLGEYRFGIRQSRSRVRYERWLNEALPGFCVLNIDEATTSHYADVREALKRSGHPIPSNDLWIAALALQYDFPVISRDRHFDSVPGLRRLTW